MQCLLSHGFLVLLLAWALRKTSFHFPLVSLCVLSFKNQVQEKKLSLTAHFSRSMWGMHDKALRMPAWEARNQSTNEQTAQTQALRFFLFQYFHNTPKEHTSK